MYNFTTNNLIESVLYDKHRIRSYIKYRILLHKIKKYTPTYETFNIIYDFIDQLNFAYFHCLKGDNRLFIKDSRKTKNSIRSLVYKDDSVTITIRLEAEETIAIEFNRAMGYPETKVRFKNGELILENKLEEQLFINCTNLIMNELYYIIRKYRKFGRVIRK